MQRQYKGGGKLHAGTSTYTTPSDRQGQKAKTTSAVASNVNHGGGPVE